MNRIAEGFSGDLAGRSGSLPRAVPNSLMSNHLHGIIVMIYEVAVGAGLALPGMGAASGASYTEIEYF